MMFLFVQLAIWLLIAGVLGFAAGWFLQARRAGKKLAEHRERYRQHIQRLEQGLADAAEEERYAKERRDPIEVSDNPKSFLSGAEEAEARRRKQSGKAASRTRAESSGLQSAQTVTLSSSAAEPVAASDAVVTPSESALESTDSRLVDESNASLVSAPAEWEGRLQNCESEVTVLRQRLGRLEQQCQPQKAGAKPLAKSVAVKSTANKSAGKSGAGSASGLKPYGMKAPDGEPDDLKRIWGVGPKLEGMLNDMGIFHYRQIAAFSADDIETVAAELEQFSDRVKRDDWISQAKQLMAEAK